MIGIGEANAMLTILSDVDGPVASTAILGNGTWAVTLSLLQDGVHNITAVTTDTAGNTAETAALVVLIGCTPVCVLGL